MLVSKEIWENYPFPELITPPTKLALKLQERIKYMFGIIVEPVIIRQSASYYKTIAFRPLWNMRTKCNYYGIASYEQASEMASKPYWNVLDYQLFNIKKDRKIIKIIY